MSLRRLSPLCFNSGSYRINTSSARGIFEPTNFDRFSLLSFSFYSMFNGSSKFSSKNQLNGKTFAVNFTLVENTCRIILSKLSTDQVTDIALLLEKEIKEFDLNEFVNLIPRSRMDELLMKVKIQREEKRFLYLFSFRKSLLKLHPSLKRLTKIENVFIKEHPSVPVVPRLKKEECHTALYGFSVYFKDSLWNEGPTFRDLAILIYRLNKRRPGYLLDFFKHLQQANDRIEIEKSNHFTLLEKVELIYHPNDPNDRSISASVPVGNVSISSRKKSTLSQRFGDISDDSVLNSENKKESSKTPPEMSSGCDHSAKPSSHGQSEMPASKKDNKDKGPFWKRTEFALLLAIVSIFYVVNELNKIATNNPSNAGKMKNIFTHIQEISFEEFLESALFKDGLVDHLVVSADRTRVYVYPLAETDSREVVNTSNAEHGIVSFSSEQGGMVHNQSGILSGKTGREYPQKREMPLLMFTIGSISSFETRLNEAIKRLSLRMVPVIWEIPLPFSTTMINQTPPNTTMPWSAPQQPTGKEHSILANGFLVLEIFISLLPLALIGYIAWKGYSITQKNGANSSSNPFTKVFNVGKSKAKLYNAETAVKIQFKDVAGMQETKAEVAEFVSFLKEPQVYAALGARIPKGAILSGPPGTGKTLLAKAMAGEAGVPFLSISGAEFVEMFVGVGAARVRDLFEEARRLSPCIVFIDEIDAIGRARGRSTMPGGGGNDERESTLNQLLVEMDGFNTPVQASEGGNVHSTSNNTHPVQGPIVVIAGTNRPDVLDPALLRPGRFDRHIAIERPDANGRKEIYMVHLSPLRLCLPETTTPIVDTNSVGKSNTHGPLLAGASHFGNSASIATFTCTENSTRLSTKGVAIDKVPTMEMLAMKLAYMTPGFVGADIANVCNEAALMAARMKDSCVNEAHLEAAVERVIAGIERRSRILSEKERSVIAHHESGHAVAGWFLEHADPVMKVTIIPRSSGALGFARILPSDGVLVSKAQMLDRICVALGGRIAEEIIFGKMMITSGAHDDLQKVTQIAYQAVSVLGMDERIGLLSFPEGRTSSTSSYSDETSRLIDARVKVMVDECYRRSFEILTIHKTKMEALAQALLEHESLQREDLEQVLGKRPFSPSHAYDLRTGGKDATNK